MWIFFKTISLAVSVLASLALIDGVMSQDTPLSIALVGIAVASLIAAAALSWKLQTTLDRRYVRRVTIIPILKRMQKEINVLRRNQELRGVDFDKFGNDQDPDEAEDEGDFV